MNKYYIMPALYLFNRRTLLAGDDLQLPSLALGSLCAAQIFVLLPVLLWSNVELLLLRRVNDEVDDGTYRYPQDDDDHFHSTAGNLSMQSSACSQATSDYTDMRCPTLLLMYMVGMSAFSSVSLYYEQQIFHYSGLGTPTLHLSMRHSLQSLIQAKLSYLACLNGSLLVFGVVCTVGYMGEYMYCYPVSWWICWFTLLTSQSVQVMLGIVSLLSILRVPPRREGMSRHTNRGESENHLYQQHVDIHSNDNNNINSRNNTEMTEELWKTRCDTCCRVLATSTCFLFGGQSIVSASESGGSEFNFYGDISRALADYFAGFEEGEEGFLDVVPSDVVLGFVVLRHMQAQRKLAAKREALEQLGCGERIGGSNSCENLTEGNMQNDDNNINSTNGNRRALFFRWGNHRSNLHNDVERALDTNSSPLQESSYDTISRNEVEPISPSRRNQEYKSFSRIVLSPSNSEDAYVIEEGAYFARHQLAIYTWMLYFYCYPITGSFRLIGRALRNKTRCNNDAMIDRGLNGQQTIVGDNFLHMHEATMLAHTRLEKTNIAYASFGAGFYETPYCIIIDDTWKTIVLSIRGSLTLEDCVVDVLLDPSPLDGLGEQYEFDGGGQYCHGGVYQCTKWLFNDLTRYDIDVSVYFGFGFLSS